MRYAFADQEQTLSCMTNRQLHQPHQLNGNLTTRDMADMLATVTAASLVVRYVLGDSSKEMSCEARWRSLVEWLEDDGGSWTGHALGRGW